MKIIHKQILAQLEKIRIIRLEIKAKEIASSARPGQFVVLMVKEEGERIPLTIVDKDEKKGTIILIFQEIGLTTKLLGELKEKESLYALLGPLGNPTEIKNYGNVILIGGGVGIAEIYPVAKALRKENNYLISLLGVKTKRLLILEKELKEISNQFQITTDDGSYGEKGLVIDKLLEILDSNEKKIDLIYAVGPILMMKKISEIGKNYNIKTIVSLNALMVDGTGMCGCCRITIAGKTKFSCVDGPEFDGRFIDWDNLLKRNTMYLEKEKHICNYLLKNKNEKSNSA